MEIRRLESFPTVYSLNDHGFWRGQGSDVRVVNRSLRYAQAGALVRMRSVTSCDDISQFGILILV